MAKNSPQLVVREHAPWKQYVLFASLMIVAVLGGYFLYQYGLSRAGHDFSTLIEERDSLRKVIKERNDELASQRDQTVALVRSSEIDKQSYKEVEESLRTLQSEILELKEEVAFYRSIVAPRESAKGLRIQRFKIEPNTKQKSFRYKLVLTQVMNQTNMTRGDIEFSIEGLQEGKPRLLALQEVEAGKQDKIAFRFKYFQNFEGDIVLPKGFVPSRVLLKVLSNRVTIEKIFDWPRANRTSDSLKKSDL